MSLDFLLPQERNKEDEVSTRVETLSPPKTSTKLLELHTTFFSKKNQHPSFLKLSQMATCREWPIILGKDFLTWGPKRCFYWGVAQCSQNIDDGPIKVAPFKTKRKLEL